jgi:excinuclease ABC subunit C
MKRVFPLRTCRKMPKKVCLEYHIGQCYGPCEHKVPAGEYRDMVDELKAFLEGRKGDLIKSLEERMKRFSARKEYEKALAVKNRLEALTAIQQLHDRSRHLMFGELDELQNALSLPRPPLRIECFDISNIAGRQAVGSMVRFAGGKPDRSGYRKFRVKEVSGIDDYSMIREVVRRRYKRLLEENGTLPDLVLIDGGKGHL